MAAFLAVASTITPFEGPKISGPEVYQLMMSHSCWEFSDRSPHRKEMAEGDLLVFYLGGNQGRYIAGEGRIAGDMSPIEKNSPKTFDRKNVPFFTFRVPLTDIKTYPANTVGMDVVEKLSFVKSSTVERKYIGLLLRSGVRRLTVEDVEMVRKAAKTGA